MGSVYEVLAAIATVSSAVRSSPKLNRERETSSSLGLPRASASRGLQVAALVAERSIRNLFLLTHSKDFVHARGFT